MLTRITTIIIITFSFNLHADLASDIHNLQTGWAQANYELKGDVQTEEFQALIKQAEAVTQNNPDTADSWIWLGIIQSTYAGKAGPFNALNYAKAAKTSLEKAIKINPDALNGSAYASLGTLYFKVPGWPIAFGDDDKAETLLKKALTINPDGIDSNYFYADYLVEEEQYKEARQYLLKAQTAPARTNRPLADKGRKLDIASLLEEVDEVLQSDDME